MWDMEILETLVSFYFWAMGLGFAGLALWAGVSIWRHFAQFQEEDHEED